jgi:hypothetical protein
MSFVTVGIHVDVLDRVIRIATRTKEFLEDYGHSLSEEDAGALKAAEETLAAFIARAEEQPE